MLPISVRMALMRDLIIVKISRSRSVASSWRDAESGATGARSSFSAGVILGSDGHASSRASFSGAAFSVHVFLLSGGYGEADSTKGGFTEDLILWEGFLDVRRRRERCRLTTATASR